MAVYQYLVSKENCDEVRGRIHALLKEKQCNTSTSTKHRIHINSLGDKYLNCFSISWDCMNIEFQEEDILFDLGDTVQFQDSWILIKHQHDQRLTTIQILDDFWLK